MLSLEPPQNPKETMQFRHAQMVSYAGNNGGGDQQHHHPMQPPMKPSPYLYAAKTRQVSSLSDEDDHGSGSGSGYNPEDSGGADGKRKFSQWQRMKWTDTMVRVLIMAVFYIGDEPTDPARKKLSSSSSAAAAAAGGLQQKKGKWKSVSRAMMEKGLYVSPQQCEDKFNDLNKRYKRVNDILGKGTACRVVENHALLDAMDLPPKLKDEARKLLLSKHLFFREMCAYHNSSGHLNASSTPSSTDPPQTPAAAAEEEEEPESETEGDSETGGEDSSEEMGKKASESMAAVKGMMEEAGKVAVEEKREWVKMKMVELEERRVGYEWEAVEMEKQRLKWIRFKCKKEREMEKTTLHIQKRRLENHRMLLLLRRMEIESELQPGRIG